MNGSWVSHILAFYRSEGNGNRFQHGSQSRPDPLLLHFLALRGIPYTECQQPFAMPRPALAAIGIKYRRIPVLSIGRDIYSETALILDKLEQLYPGSHMGGKTGVRTSRSSSCCRSGRMWTSFLELVGGNVFQSLAGLHWLILTVTFFRQIASEHLGPIEGGEAN